MADVKIDFVARDLPHGGWGLVIVEEGPWPSETMGDELRRLQNRLYDCLDVVLQGQFTSAYPESSGKPVMIRVDSYNINETALRRFFETFSNGVLQIPDIAAALKDNDTVPTVLFELNCDTTS
ncbi:MAG: hypothetical protein AAGH76_15155 [Pseudomonadota bacterium]